MRTATKSQGNKQTFPTETLLLTRWPNSPGSPGNPCIPVGPLKNKHTKQQQKVEVIQHNTASWFDSRQDGHTLPGPRKVVLFQTQQWITQKADSRKHNMFGKEVLNPYRWPCWSDVSWGPRGSGDSLGKGQIHTLYTYLFER